MERNPFFLDLGCKGNLIAAALSTQPPRAQAPPPPLVQRGVVMPISKLSACAQTIFCHAHAHESRAIHAVIWVILLFPMCAPVNANTDSNTIQTFAGVIDRQEHTDEGRRRRGSGGMGQVTPKQQP